MSQQKFKVGDRVVIPSNEYGNFTGKVFTVINVNNDITFKNRLLGLNGSWSDDELVHEDVYNSSLYKALQENEND